MGCAKIFAISLILAIIATAITGVINTTPSGLVGAKWYGFPDTWLRYLVVGPQYNPWAIDSFGFIIDVILWTAVIGTFIWAVKSRCDQMPASPKAQKRGRR